MAKEKKLLPREVAAMLQEALQPFCDEENREWRPALATPFRQKDGDGRDCIVASDGKVLIRIRAKEAGVAVGGFTKSDKLNANRVIPTIGFERLLDARAVKRSDMQQTIEQMKQYETEKQQVAVADVWGVWLTIDGVSHLEVAMRICGAEWARLVWHEDMKVMLQIDNDHDREAVCILHMGCKPEDCHVFTLPSYNRCEDRPTYIDWQRGAAAWADIKADLTAREEAERMARREVYLVEVVKRAYIPVYARNTEEAQRLADGESWFDPEDDGDDEWMLGDTVPEAEDLDDLDDCYKHIITRDGVVERDKIYELDQISEEWEKNHKEISGRKATKH